MPSIIDKIQPLSGNAPREQSLLIETFSAAGVTDAVRFADCQVVVQPTGSASQLTVIVERNVLDPQTSPNTWGPAEDETFDGNPAAGMSARVYIEPSSAYWRVRVASIAGGAATIAMSGVTA